MATLEAGSTVTIESLAERDVTVRAELESSEHGVCTFALRVVPGGLHPGHRVEVTHLDDGGLSLYTSEIVEIDEPTRRLSLREPERIAHIDRRRHRRILTEVPVEWSPLGHTADHVEAHQARTVDISTGGVRLEGPDLPMPGSRFVLAIHIPGGAAVATAECLPEHSDDVVAGRPRVRARFDRLHDVSVQRIRAWVLDGVEQAVERAEVIVEALHGARRS